MTKMIGDNKKTLQFQVISISGEDGEFVIS